MEDQTISTITKAVRIKVHLALLCEKIHFKKSKSDKAKDIIFNSVSQFSYFAVVRSPLLQVK